MIIEGKFNVAASSEKVWEFIFNVDAVASCMPGVEKAEQIDDKNFAGAIVAKVGPISVNFEGKATISHIKPLQYIAISGRGKDKMTASMVKGSGDLVLTSISREETQLSYKADVSIVGRLGQFGEGIMRETASVMIEEFVNRMRSQIEGTPEALHYQKSDLSMTRLVLRVVLRQPRRLIRGLVAWWRSTIGSFIRLVLRRP